MEEFLKWLPALITLTSVVGMFSTMRAGMKFSDKRHDDNEAKIQDHELRIRSTENAITGLKLFDELQSRVRKDT